MKEEEPLSLVSQGTRVQFVIGVILTSLIPLLVAGFLLSPLRVVYGLNRHAALVILACTAVLAILGLVLLLRYPINVIRLRRFLESLAAGNLPDPATIELIRGEDDMAAIEDCIVSIIHQTETRISALKQQARALVEAETQRTMIASLGAACHHLGQPTTVITTCLDIIARQECQPETRELIEQCKASAVELGKILDRLRSVAEFRVEPYRVAETGEALRTDEYILKITGEKT